MSEKRANSRMARRKLQEIRRINVSLAMRDIYRDKKTGEKPHISPTAKRISV